MILKTSKQGNPKDCQTKSFGLLLPQLIVFRIQNLKLSVGFRESFLKQDRVVFVRRNVVNLFVVYELNTGPRIYIQSLH